MVKACDSCDFIENDTNLILNITDQYFDLINQTLDGEFCPTIIINETASGLVDLKNSYVINNLNA